MTVAGTLSPFDQVSVTVMPAGSDMGETVRGHSAVCAMAMPLTAWKHMHFTVEQVGGSTKSPQYTHRARTAYSTPSRGRATPRVWTPTYPPPSQTKRWPGAPEGGGEVQDGRGWRPRTHGVAPPPPRYSVKHVKCGKERGSQHNVLQAGVRGERPIGPRNQWHAASSSCHFRRPPPPCRSPSQGRRSPTTPWGTVTK